MTQVSMSMTRRQQLRHQLSQLCPGDSRSCVHLSESDITNILNIIEAPIPEAPVPEQISRELRDAIKTILALPDSSQTQEPTREGSQASIEAATPRTVTEVWAGKWLQLCRKHSIDPVSTVDELDRELNSRWWTQHHSMGQ